MSKQVLISMLRQGNTGNEILSILESLSADTVSDNGSAQSFGGGEPSAYELEF